MDTNVDPGDRPRDDADTMLVGADTLTRGYTR
jgi:hypothetical protein